MPTTALSPSIIAGAPVKPIIVLATHQNRSTSHDHSRSDECGADGPTPLFIICSLALQTIPPLRWLFTPAMTLALNLLLTWLLACFLSAEGTHTTLGPQTGYHAACVAIEAAFSGTNSSVFYSGAREQSGIYRCSWCAHVYVAGSPNYDADINLNNQGNVERSVCSVEPSTAEDVGKIVSSEYDSCHICQTNRPVERMLVEDSKFNENTLCRELGRNLYDRVTKKISCYIGQKRRSQYESWLLVYIWGATCALSFRPGDL